MCSQRVQAGSRGVGAGIVVPAHGAQVVGVFAAVNLAADAELLSQLNRVAHSGGSLSSVLDAQPCSH